MAATKKQEDAVDEDLKSAVSLKRKIVKQGIFKAELNWFLMKELAEDGYSGLVVQRLPHDKVEVIIRATRTQNVLGEKARRIRELQFLVERRFGFKEDQLILAVEKVSYRGLCAAAQVESLRYKLIGGLAVRRACYGVLRFIMEEGARGCELTVSGKIRGQRAKSMKFVDGVMLHSGEATTDYVQTAVRHVLLRQGVLGLKVKIMLPHDACGIKGPVRPLPDHIDIAHPKETAPIHDPFVNDWTKEEKKQEMAVATMPPDALEVYR